MLRLITLPNIRNIKYYNIEYVSHREFDSVLLAEYHCTKRSASK
jgi:hypothetical protein